MGDKHEPTRDEVEFTEELHEADADEGPAAEADQSPADEEQPPTDTGARDDELAQLRDALLRTRADMDNMHKRSQRELEKARKFQLEGLMRELLPVIDGLDQGLERASEGEDAYEGLVLTRKLLLKALEGHGLVIIDPEPGQPFDPKAHEAMTTQPSKEAEPDSVLTVLQKGYWLHDRLLRPARVIVAKAP